MSKYLPKAEKMFQQKLKTALAPTGYIYALGEALEYQALLDGEVDLFEDEMLVRQWSVCFDFNYISELFNIYGCYLLLIEDDRDLQAETESGTDPSTPSGLSGLVYPAGAHRNLPCEPEDGVSDSGEEWSAAKSAAEDDQKRSGQIPF